MRLDNGDYITHRVSDNAGTVYAETSVAPGTTQYNVYAVSIAGSMLWILPVGAYVNVGGPSLWRSAHCFSPNPGHRGVPQIICLSLSGTGVAPQIRTELRHRV